jgi:hypothetical protein
VDGADDLAAIDALEVDARDAEVGVSELALNDDKRDSFVRHFNRVSVPELVVVPTSAQAPLSRPARYADVRRKLLLRGDQRKNRSAYSEPVGRA